MPVRVTCPACSATLSIRDEFAGRAVKCPKCAGLIPPQPAAPPTISDAESVATVPPPAPPPEPEPQPQPEVAAKAESEAPAARTKDDRDDEDDRPRKKRRDEEEDRPRKKRDEDEDEDRPRKPREDEQGEDDRPRKKRDEDEDDRPRKRRDDDDDDDRPRKKRREEDDRDDDRPRPRRRDEDDEDDRPRKKRRRDDDDDDRPVVRPAYTPRGSNVGIIFAAGALLLGFAAVGGGIYAYNQNEKANRETEAANAAAKDKANTANAFITNFERIKIGDARGRADEALGSGKVAGMEDLTRVFRGSNDKKIHEWAPKVSEGRVLMWQSEESFALVALHPDASGRVMAKALRAKNGSSIDAGDLNDASFLRRFPLKGEPPPKGKQPQPGD